MLNHEVLLLLFGACFLIMELNALCHIAGRGVDSPWREELSFA